MPSQYSSKRKRLKITIIILISIWIPSFYTFAQDADSSGIHKGRLALVAGTTAGIYIGGAIFLNEVWYADKARVPFQFYNDNQGWLQMDKFAHSYIAYYQSYWTYEALLWSGVDKKKAIWYAAPIGFLMQLPIEIFDGMYEGYGFSWGDVVANTTGSVIFTVQQALWNEQKVIPKFSFWPSEYADIRPGILGESFSSQLVQDYNAQTYWFSFSPGNVFHLEKWPEWLCLSIGYSGNGMLAEFENPEFILGQDVRHIQRYRQVFLSLDLNLRKIKTRSGLVNGLFHAMNMIKIPAPAIEWNGREGLAFRPFYF
jgi:hypothetical protein